MTATALKEKIRELSTQGLELVKDEQKTPADKRTELDRIEAEVKKFQDELADLEHVDAQRKRFEGLTTTEPAPGDKPDDPAAPVTAKSIGSQFVESAQYKGVVGRPGQWNSGAVEVDAKATMTESASTGILPQLRPGLVDILFRRLTIADLMPTLPISGNANSMRYLKETSATNAAATVAEEGPKPASTLVFAPVDEALTKIANTIKVTDEMLQDYEFVRAYIDSRLMLFVQLIEEDQLLNGNGTPPNMTGLLNRSGLQGAQARGTDTRAVAVYKEITKIRATGFIEPEAIVFHPTDWQTARLEADANGQFFAGGPFTGAYGQGAVTGQGGSGNYDAAGYWGLRVVVTPAIAQGTALLGAFSTCAGVLRKGGLTVEATNSNEDDFLKNRIAIRAEERVGLAVFRPGGFGTVTGL